MDIWDKVINSSNQQGEVPNHKTTSRCIEIGATCPQCGCAKLEYDGKLHLYCPECGFEATAGFT